MKAALALAALTALAACSKPAEQAAAPKVTPVSTATATATATATPPAVLPSTARDPAKVLITWAEAMSLKQWDAAYLYWGEQGTGTGLTLAQFKAKWGKLGNPEFEIHPGKTEGAAGSSFYTAPVVLIDGARHDRGQVVLRRVNDVPGATPEQLRWHIESMTIEP